MSRSLKRADAHTPGFAGKFGDWVNGRRATRAEGMLKAKEFKDLDAQGIEGIKQFQAGIRTGKYADVQKYFDEKHVQVEQSGIRLGFKENYLPQLWENSADEVFAAARKLGLKPRFTLQSVLENYQAGINVGLKPKFKSISDLVGWYEKTANKAMVDRQFFDYLKQNNLIQPKSKAPANGTWEALDPDHFPIQKFQAKGKEFQGVLMAPKEIAGNINNYLREPQNRVLDWTSDAASLSKNYAMSAGIPGTGINAHGFNILARNIMGKGLLKGGTEMAGYMVNPKSAARDLEGLMQTAPAAMKNGLTLTTEGFELGQNNLKELVSSLGGKGKITDNRILDFHTKYFEKPLFHEIIPALKLKYYNQFSKELLAKGMSPTEAGRAAAEATNTLYGGINWEAMGRNRDVQNLWRTIFLAPDWFETNARMGQGMAQAMIDPNTPQGKQFGRVAKNILIAYVAANVANVASSGHPMWENPPGHTLDVQLGMSGDRNRYLRPFGTAADFLRLPLDTMVAAIKDKDIGQGARIAKNRLSMPISSAANLLLNVDDFGKPITGQDVYGRKIPMQQQVAGVANEVVGPFTPQYVRNPALYATGRQNAEQAIAGTAESPLRYAKPPKKEGRTRSRVRSRQR